MAVVSFQNLWANHPALTGNPEPCKDKDGQPAFAHQCAIRMGVALESSGVKLGSFNGAKCWHGHTPAHVLRAEELAKWMAGPLGKPLLGDVQKTTRGAQTSSQQYRGKKEIVFLLNFWGPGSQGDHIDLWNGHDMAQGDPTYFGRAQEVWFWPVN